MSDVVIGLIMVQKATIDGDTVKWKTFKPTSGHGAFLKRLGYTVRDELLVQDKGKYLQVECAGFEVVQVDTSLTGDAGLEEVAKLKKVIAEKKLISYPSQNGSQFSFMGSDGTVNSGKASKMPGAVRYLDRVVPGCSALVAKRADKQKTRKVVESTFSFDDLFSDDDDKDAKKAAPVKKKK
tara:strand:- start:15879 stop:16421 length:543 start_codon:yes stop_codon:yes gene_type:complete